MVNHRQLRNKENKSELIVVATLVEKLPNLANLTRTCEVFGVDQLVINNKNIMNDDTFKHITVTAHKWMPMIEVVESNLV